MQKFDADYGAREAQVSTAAQNGPPPPSLGMQRDTIVQSTRDRLSIELSPDGSEKLNQYVLQAKTHMVAWH